MSVDFALIVLSIVAVLAFFSFLTGRDTFLSFFSLLLVAAATSLISTELKVDSRSGLLQIMIFVFLSINFLLSRIEVLRNIKFGVYGTAISTLLLLVVGSGRFSIYDFEFSYYNYSVWVLPILGTLIFVGSELLSGVFSQFVGFETRSSFQQLSQLFLISLVGFYAYFVASYFGYFLVGIGYIASSFYREDHKPNAGFGLLLLALSPFVGTLAGIDTVDLELGKNVFGLLTGFAGIWFLFIVSQSKINPIAFSMFGYILYLIFTVLILFIGSQKADLGGADAYLSYIIGSALAITVYSELKLSQLIFPSLLCIGIYFAPKILSNGDNQSIKDKKTVINRSGGTDKNTEQDPFEVKGLAINELTGKYEIINSTSIIHFSLGPKGGKTKGVIKNFSGSVNFEENTGASTFSVEIPVKNLTTNNELRDESLREKAYFNIIKFPSMMFESEKLSLIDDYYELDGEFTMIGETKPLKVLIKYTGITERGGEKFPTFVGKANLDRTKHGMTPDSKEGNVVEFDFKIELKKIISEQIDNQSTTKKKDTQSKKKKSKKKNRSSSD